MADRAHIRFVDPDFQVIKKFNSETGRIRLEDGRTTSPVVIGFIDGNDRVVQIVVVTNDTSTGPDVLRTVVETVDETAVTRTVTIRDLTAQEITDRGTNIVNERFSAINDDALHDAIRDIMHRYNNRIRTLEAEVAAMALLFKPPLDLATVPDATWTKTAYNDWFKTFIQSSVDNGAT